MQLNEWFDKGMSIESYVDELTDHRENFEKIYADFSMPDDAAVIEKIQNNNLKALVIAEPWCGHCMLNIPILKRISEKSGMNISVCLRDTHPQLMDQYETNGKRIIPIFIFIDDEGREVSKWGPRAPKVADIHNRMLQSLPEKDAPEYNEVFKEKVSELVLRFSTDHALWNHVYEDIKKSLI